MNNVFTSEFVTKMTETLTEKTEGGVSCTRAALAESLGLEVVREDGKVLATSVGLRVVDAVIALGLISDFGSSRGRTGGLVRKGVILATKAAKSDKEAANLERKRARAIKDLAALNATGVSVEALGAKTSSSSVQEDDDLDVEIEDEDEDEILF